LRSCHQAEAVGHHQIRGFGLARSSRIGKPAGVFVELFVLAEGVKEVYRASSSRQ